MICLPYCNVGAISIKNGVAMINQRVCVECWVCYRNHVCPNDAFQPVPLRSYGDVFKHILSDPTVTSKGTGVPGRGTEEAKTNDVTGRYAKGVYGICIDMGRPGTGVYLSDVEMVAMAVAGAGLKFGSPDETPLSAVMTDLRTGRIRSDLLDVHVLSIIIEGTCEKERLKPILEALLKIETEINTVFSLGIVTVKSEGSDDHLRETLDQVGIDWPIRGKVNVGLGRPLFSNRGT